jgi:hypothetical protein
VYREATARTRGIPAHGQAWERRLLVLRHERVRGGRTVSKDDVKTAGSTGGKAGDPAAQLAALVMGWIEDVQAANQEHLEAELDRASFESFPASDPVAAASTNQRASTLRLECLVADDRLTFCRTARSDDSASPERGEPYDRLELETPDGMVIIVEVRRDDDADEERLDPLELPPEHASIVSRQDERPD